MKAKMTIRELLEKRRAVDKILKKDMPFKLAYRLNRVADKFMSEYNQIEKTRTEMIKTFGKRDDKTGGYRVLKEKNAQFQNAWREMLDEEISFTVSKIPWECIENIEMSPKEVAQLAEFIDNPAEITPPVKKKKKTKE